MTESYQEIFRNVLASSAYELGILLTFFISWMVWHTLFRQGRTKGSKGRGPKDFEIRAEPNKAANSQKADRARILKEAQQIIILSQEQYTKALRLYRDLVRSGQDKEIREEQFYLALIQASIRVGHTDVVQELFQAMKRNSIARSLEFFQSTLKLLASKHLYQDCLMFYKLFKDELPAERTVCSCITFAAAECNEPSIALEVIEKLDSSTGRDYQHVFRHFAKTGDSNQAVKLLAKLKDEGLEIESILVNVVLASCVAANRLDMANDVMNEYSCLDVVSYNTVLKGYVQVKDLEKCFELVEGMASAGITPDDVTYGTLLDACIADHDLDRATMVVDKLINSGCPMNTVLYTTFMKGFVRGHMLNKAMDLYRLMRAENMNGHSDCKPDLITYSVLIKGNCDKRNLEQALCLLDEMFKDGVEADDIIVNHLLDGCGHVSNVDLGQKIFDDLIVSGRVKPSPYTVTGMMKLYGKCGRCNQALNLVKTMEQRFGIKPSVIIFTCLMSGCVRHKRLDEAFEAFDLMKSQGLQPDKTTIQTLLQGCIQTCEWRRLIFLVQEGLSSKIPIPGDVLNQALSAMRSKSVPEEHLLHQLMLRHHVQVAACGPRKGPHGR